MLLPLDFSSLLSWDRYIFPQLLVIFSLILLKHIPLRKFQKNTYSYSFSTSLVIMVTCDVATPRQYLCLNHSHINLIPCAWKTQVFVIYIRHRRDYCHILFAKETVLAGLIFSFAHGNSLLELIGHLLTLKKCVCKLYLGYITFWTLVLFLGYLGY